MVERQRGQQRETRGRSLVIQYYIIMIIIYLLLFLRILENGVS